MREGFEQKRKLFEYKFKRAGRELFLVHNALPAQSIPENRATIDLSFVSSFPNRWGGGQPPTEKPSKSTKQNIQQR